MPREVFPIIRHGSGVRSKGSCSGPLTPTCTGLITPYLQNSHGAGCDEKAVRGQKKQFPWEFYNKHKPQGEGAPFASQGTGEQKHSQFFRQLSRQQPCQKGAFIYRISYAVTGSSARRFVVFKDQMAFYKGSSTLVKITFSYHILPY